MTVKFECDARCTHAATEDTLRALGYDLPALRGDATFHEKVKHERRVADATYDAACRCLLRSCPRTGR